MATKKKGLPDVGIDTEFKGKKAKDNSEDLIKRLNRARVKEAKKQAGIAKAKKTRETKKMQSITDGMINAIPKEPYLPEIAPPTKSSRFEKFVQKVSNMEDITKLKKIIYNRNYQIKKKFEKENPDIVARNAVLMFPPIYDLRTVSESTFKRLSKIHDKQKLVEELRKLIINTTRRRNKPKSTADYSNKEQDYLANALTALNEAVQNWSDDILRMKIQGTLKQITMGDIQKIFSTIPSYWAISSGYYYAVENFDAFMDEIFKLIEINGVKLTKREKSQIYDRLFKNDPRDHKN